MKIACLQFQRYPESDYLRKHISSNTHPSDAPTLERIVLNGFLPEQLEGAIQRADFEHYLTTPGSFDGRLLHIDFEGFSFDAGNYSRMLYVNGEMPTDTVALGFVSAEQPDGLLNGQEMRGDRTFAYSERLILETKLPAYSQWFSFQVPRKSLECVGIDFSNDQSGLITARGPKQLTMLKRNLHNALNVLNDSALDFHQPEQHAALLRSQLEGIYADFLSTILFNNNDSTIKASTANYRRAVTLSHDYMEAHLQQTVSVSQLCQETGLSYRTLERAFKIITGMSPQHYLRVMRLLRTRNLLEASHPAESSVSDIAIACGCFHLGRFSIDYRKLFRETPSTTLSRHP